MNQQNKEQNEKKHNYFYKITNLINGKFYYGIRSTNKEIEKDNYWGSGKLVKEAIKKYGKENFIKEIIANYLTRIEVNNHEKQVVTQELIELEECYNLKTGGHSGYPSSEVRKRMSEWQIGKVVSETTKQKIREVLNSPETKQKRKEHIIERLEKNDGIWVTDLTRQKISETLKSKQLTGENSPNFGRIVTQKTRDLRSKALTGKPSKNKGKKVHTEEQKEKWSKERSGENHPCFGKELTDEHKQKISKQLKGRVFSDETKNKMRNSSRKNKGRPCYIMGIYYNSIVEACEQLNHNKDFISYRLKSKDEKWNEWQYAIKDDNISG